MRRAVVAILTIAAGWIATALLAAGCGGGDASTTTTPATATATGATSATTRSEGMALRPAGSDGAPLGYLEYLPPGYSDGTPRPLLIFLHGFAENGDGSETGLRKVFKLGVPALIQDGDWPGARPFIVLAPQYPPDEAEECRLGDEIDAFVGFAIDRYAVDASRIYLTGISCGAIGVWDYLASSHHEVAAAVPISGHAVDAFATAACDLGRLPIWAFHGGLDPVVPKRYIVEPINRIKACKNPEPVEIRLTLYPDADHDAWSRTYDLSGGHDVYKWLLAHERA